VSSASWGLNGFHEDYVLFSASKNSILDQQRVATMIAKEMAHYVIDNFRFLGILSTIKLIIYPEIKVDWKLCHLCLVVSFINQKVSLILIKIHEISFKKGRCVVE